MALFKFSSDVKTIQFMMTWVFSALYVTLTKYVHDTNENKNTTITSKSHYQ